MLAQTNGCNIVSEKHPQQKQTIKENKQKNTQQKVKGNKKNVWMIEKEQKPNIADAIFVIAIISLLFYYSVAVVAVAVVILLIMLRLLLWLLSPLS